MENQRLEVPARDSSSFAKSQLSGLLPQFLTHGISTPNPKELRPEVPLQIPFHPFLQKIRFSRLPEIDPFLDYRRTGVWQASWVIHHWKNWELETKLQSRYLSFLGKVPQYGLSENLTSRLTIDMTSQIDFQQRQLLGNNHVLSR
ncbi:conserved protein with 2 CBS domains [Striga asiatica]|uniref:Conserved protein with 2 CBS domains n=1 Tax=Striga asiatica TaxID=4170 RepID=A0A5A7QDJ7_STRAF|nr:conserved protein with 2 CBS domains [Striga asiatica]